MLIIAIASYGLGKYMYVSQMRMFGYEQENRNVLRCCLKTASDGAVQM